MKVEVGDRMKYYLGVDGGGTKTAFALSNENNEILAEVQTSGCSYLEIGIEGVLLSLQKGIRECLNQSGVDLCQSICIGLPCYGENQAIDSEIEMRLKVMFPDSKLLLVNDAVVGWAGSLEAKEGIHLVAGTGSLAIGKGIGKEFARSGGWNEFFSDEGSCYWVARKTMQLFSKQSDGRVEKGPLYTIIKEKYQLNHDFELIDYILKIADVRNQVADFQKIALEAADAGDKSVQRLYEKAAEELAEMAISVKNQLTWNFLPVKVSYYGGLFHAEKWVLPKLKDILAKNGCELHQPIASAVQGALFLAKQNI